MTQRSLAWAQGRDPAPEAQARNAMALTTARLGQYPIAKSHAQAGRDPRAHAMLAVAHAERMARADGISDADARAAFLRSVPYHRAILTAWEAVHAGATPG